MSRTSTVAEKLQIGEWPRLRNKSKPTWVAPMLATLSHSAFSRQGWLFGPKLDGARCLTLRSGDNLQLVSRNLQSLYIKLSSIETKAPPFTGNNRPGRGVHWGYAKAVAQIAFGEWTQGGKLRQPRFLGLRDDKEARDVIREKSNGGTRRDYSNQPAPSEDHTAR